MSTRIFVPRDSAALALGADDVAQAIRNEATRRSRRAPWCAMARAGCCGWSR